MAVLKFKTFSALDRFEREGKGMTWNFKADQAYYRKVLRFYLKIPYPAGLYKFKTFEEAEAWERKWWITSGTSKKNP